MSGGKAHALTLAVASLLVAGHGCAGATMRIAGQVEPGQLARGTGYALRVPADWFRARFDQASKEFEKVNGMVADPSADPAGGEVLFLMSPHGEYVLIERDGPPGERSSDADWALEVEGTGVRRVVEGRPCKKIILSGSMPALDECSSGDGRLDIDVLPAPLEHGGHKYRIKVGNVRSESDVRLEALRSCLLSLRFES